MLADDFLSTSSARSIDWQKPAGAPVAFGTVEVLFGNGEKPLEVAVATSLTAPKADDIRKLWKTRANRGAPVLLVVLHLDAGSGELLASVIGTDGDPSPLVALSSGRVERIAAAALEEPNRHQAARTLDRLLASVSRDGLTAGLVNSGLFAAHELRDSVPRREDWGLALTRSLPLLGKTGRTLLDALGFKVEARGSTLLALSDDNSHHAIAVVLDVAENFDRTSQRFGGVSPVSQALAQAQKERLPWVVALRRNQIRLYPANPDIGVGRKGLTETYVELDLTILDDGEAAYLSLLFSPQALARGGSVDEIIHHSSVYATELGSRLRGRIYEDVVPDLAVAVARRMSAKTEADLSTAYHRTLIILFRLLFVAYAEDRGLLPFERNPRYTRNALKTYAKDFAEDPGQMFSPDSTSIWEDLVQVWNAIDSGEPRWDVPAYNGGLFSTDAETHPDGAAVSALALKNLEIGPALSKMLVDADASGERGPVDFRSLSVREFGTIYEGLLESSLSIAPVDLSLDRQQTYVPAKEGDEVTVPSGGVYFHNASGQRKSSGSYFTKSFAVEHLLDTSLEPAIAEHLARVEILIAADDTRQAAADAFFDFRVADLAMGSGHFLVAAIDRIEARFSAFLAENALPAIADELHRLDQAARSALGEELGELAEIEPSLLLRRQIARRCVYGLDINLIAVELARLGIWIHTFVPGLPMSSLDHGLAHANSLTGMGTVDETLAALDPQLVPGQLSFFSDSIQAALQHSRTTLLNVARASEATKQEVRQAAQEHRRALVDAEEARLLMDAAVAVRLGLLPVPNGPGEAIASLSANTEQSTNARNTLSALMPAHFPFLFPEVFLRERPGFDVILGNPPWQEATIEEDAFWGRHQPGLRSLPQREQEIAKAKWREERPDLVAVYEAELSQAEAIRRALTSGAYPGMGTGDPDLYKAFCWRFWNLAAQDGGRIGVVLPRSALSAKGSAEFRSELFAHAERVDVTTLLNTKGWVFDEAEHRYTIGLLSVVRRESTRTLVALRGPYPNMARYNGGMVREPAVFYGTDVKSWNDTASLPLLPSDESMEVFAQIREAPRLDLDDGMSWRARPQTELHATNDKPLMDLVSKDCPDGYWPVFKGESFDIWKPDTGTYYAWADPQVLLPQLQEKRLRGGRNRKSAFSEFDLGVLGNPESLPCLRPRIAFRDISRSTDTRTVRAALLPPSVFITNKGPYLLWPRGDSRDEAYLLGVLSSIPLDWYARRFVEISMNFFIFNPLPIPRPPLGDPLRDRVIELGGRLACPDERFAGWAQLVGVEWGPVAADSKSDLIHELDAVVAHLYGLTGQQLTHVFETFQEGWDYEPRLEAVLEHYDRWTEVAQKREYTEAGGRND